MSESVNAKSLPMSEFSSPTVQSLSVHCQNRPLSSTILIWFIIAFEQQHHHHSRAVKKPEKSRKRQTKRCRDIANFSFLLRVSFRRGIRIGLEPLANDTVHRTAVNLREEKSFLGVKFAIEKKQVSCVCGLVDKEKCEGEEKENRADYFLSLVEEVLERGGTPNLRWSCFCFPLAKERRSDDGQIENSHRRRAKQSAFYLYASEFRTESPWVIRVAWTSGRLTSSSAHDGNIQNAIHVDSGHRWVGRKLISSSSLLWRTMTNINQRSLSRRDLFWPVKPYQFSGLHFVVIIWDCVAEPDLVAFSCCLNQHTSRFLLSSHLIY